MTISISSITRQQILDGIVKVIAFRGRAVVSAHVADMIFVADKKPHPIVNIALAMADLPLDDTVYLTAEQKMAAFCEENGYTSKYDYRTGNITFTRPA